MMELVTIGECFHFIIVVYKTTNVYKKDDEKIFFISDPSHLLKTIQNCFQRGKLWVSLYQDTQSCDQVRVCETLCVIYSNQLLAVFSRL